MRGAAAEPESERPRRGPAEGILPYFVPGREEAVAGGIVQLAAGFHRQYGSEGPWYSRSRAGPGVAPQLQPMELPQFRHR